MAGRPCRGTKTATSTGWRIEVPLARGSARRMRRTFADEASADAWRSAALSALDLGLGVPEPAAWALAAELAAATAAANPATATGGADDGDGGGDGGGDGAAQVGAAIGEASFADVAADWVAETYDDAQRGGLERKQGVEATIANHLMPFMTANGFLTGSDVTRAAYRGLFTAKLAPVDPDAVRYGVHSMLTVEAAIALTGASKSTIRRRLRDGEFPGSVLGADRRRMIPHADLVAAGLTGPPLRTGPRASTGYAQDVVGDMRRVLDGILHHGVQTAGWTLTFKPKHVPKAIRDIEPPDRAQVRMGEAAVMAEHLHAVHQLVLWLIRILGLRISEAYGIEVGDVIADGERGLVRIYRQGGRGFLVRDTAGKKEKATSKKKLKNRRSRRVLIVPRQIMAVITIVIEVFHTDPLTGVVDTGARLIPGLRVANRGGQGGFRSALTEAATATAISVGVDNDGQVMYPTPKDMRAGSLSDLAWENVPETVRKRWGGHTPGRDVHHRHYVLDDPAFAHLLPATAALERTVDADCPDGLIVATTRRCTTGSQGMLAPHAERIDAALVDAGWLIDPTGEHDETLCDTAAVAELLGLALTTARRWMAAHPDAQMVGGRRQMKLEVVLAERDALAARRTLLVLAAELKCDYHQLYYWVGNHQLEVEHVGTDVLLTAKTETRLRELLASQQALEKRAVPVATAATMLGYSTRIIDRLLASGHLSLDPQRGPRLARYVTRKSIATIACQQHNRRAG
ncbi:MAG: hypothetical protein WCP28_16640 [Actinomycetes bacterium]